ncbi:response regulator [Ferruginibacter albus]|uniref:response regulator n=1 Tax=Ferruginibacter albus TaxID=2875540 RepID=UPI001CC366D4|nr:response regulator [Ferruginibacter albus]UAY51096.1 response regulator [Ferruginibacter albus]
MEKIKMLLSMNHNGIYFVFLMTEENVRMKDKIIIVDDDPGIQEIIKVIFDKAGYETTVFSNGNNIFTGQYQLPDIFLLDKELVGKSGSDICKFLKSQRKTKDIPVILFSAISDLDKVAKEAGADNYIEKPFLKTELLDKVAAALRHDNNLRASA